MKKDEFLELTKHCENIIFDFGGIFFNLEYERTTNAFTALSDLEDTSHLFSKKNQKELFKTPSIFLGC